MYLLEIIYTTGSIIISNVSEFMKTTSWQIVGKGFLFAKVVFRGKNALVIGLIKCFKMLRSIWNLWILNLR